MSADEHLSPLQFRTATTRLDQTVHVANTEHGGYVLDGNGAGRKRWSVDYPDGDYALGETKREVLSEAHEDYAWRSKR